MINPLNYESERCRGRSFCERCRGSYHVGIVSMCDILKAAKENGPEIEKITAEQIMSKAPITADRDTSLDDLAKIMFENNYAVIPIVKGKKLVGIVSAREIIDTYVEPHLYSTFEE